MVKAGNCWLTEGGIRYSRMLYQAVKNVKPSRNYLEQNVRCLIKTILDMEALA